jgi:hypothetical protein
LVSKVVLSDNRRRLVSLKAVARQLDEFFGWKFLKVVVSHLLQLPKLIRNRINDGRRPNNRQYALGRKWYLN